VGRSTDMETEPGVEEEREEGCTDSCDCSSHIYTGLEL
jgi:hypothetical protein